MGLNGRSADNAQLQPGPFMLEVIGRAELGRMAGVAPRGLAARTAPPRRPQDDGRKERRCP